MTVTLIAPGARVDPAARLAQGVSIGAFVVIEAGVEVGPGTRIEAGSILHSGTVIGSDCRIGPYAVIGGTPMDSSFRGEHSFAILGDRVTLREFATVHRATGEGQATRVSDDTLVMSYAHVSHNVQVGRGCVLTTAVQLGGHSQVGERAVLGSNALLHQFCRVGEYAMFGAGSGSNRDVLPFLMARGNPARHYRLNRLGLQRNGIDGERYAKLERAVRALRRRERDEFERLADESEEVDRLRTFIAQSERGVLRFGRGGER